MPATAKSFHVYLIVTTALILCVPRTANPDTIYHNKQGGDEQVLAQGVLVTSESPSIQWLYHFGDGIVLDSYCPTLPGESCRAAKSSPEEQEALIEEWKSSGYTAEVTASSGLKTIVHNLYLTSGAPEGYAGIAAPRGTLERVYIELKMIGGLQRIHFHRLSRMDFAGTSVTAFLRDGQTLKGELQGKVSGGATLPPILSGIESYKANKAVKFRSSVSNVASVKFISSKLVE